MQLVRFVANCQLPHDGLFESIQLHDDDKKQIYLYIKSISRNRTISMELREKKRMFVDMNCDQSNDAFQV